MTPAVPEILAAVADLFEVSVPALKGPSRLEHMVRARWAAALLLREFPMRGSGLVRSSTTIGRALGNRDHSTILHALRQADRLAAADGEFARALAELRDRLSMVPA